MKNFFLTLLTFCFISLHTEAQIAQINDMKEAVEYFNKADSKTWVIFDVDMVLIQPSDPAFQMANMMRYKEAYSRVMKEVPKEKRMWVYGLMTINSDQVLIDGQIPEYLNQLSKRDIPVMALTANLTGKFSTVCSMEKHRVENLQKLGIDFTHSAPYAKPFVLDELDSYRGHYSIYCDGILFTNGPTVSKGDVFLSFVKKINSYPKKIIFIDDREDNLKSLETAIQSLETPIEYQGLHFLGAQHYPSPLISEEEFKCRFQKLASEAIALD